MKKLEKMVWILLLIGSTLFYLLSLAIWPDPYITKLGKKQER